MSRNDKSELGAAEVAFLASSLEAPPLSSSIKNRIKAKIAKRISGECPEGGKSIFKSQDGWFEVKDKITIKILHQDHVNKVQTSLWRLQPGAVISSHRHGHDEECLVMEGAIQIGDHHLNAGDFHFMEKDSYHPDVTTKHGALLYLRHDMREHLMGPAV